MVQTHIHPGILPPFWDRSAVFFVNLESIFFGNESKVDQLKSDVSGVDTYGGRLVPIFNIVFKGDHNILLLERPPNRFLLRYVKDILGLSLPELKLFSREAFDSIDKSVTNNDVVAELNELLHDISNHPSEYVDGFVTDEILYTWAKRVKKPLINSPETCCDSNNKLNLYRFLNKNELPVFDSEVVQSPEEVYVLLEKFRKKGYKKMLVKSPLGASGVGMFQVDTDDHNAVVPKYLFSEGECLVQGWLEEGVNSVNRINSPSVQFFISEDSIYLYDITEQILSRESVHEGNVSPPLYLQNNFELKNELFNQAKKACEWIYSNGYRGIGSVDFLVVYREDSYEVYICEINARFTGATYPSVLARHFIPEGAWIMQNLRTTKPIDSENLYKLIEEANALFMPGKSEGFLPINFNLGEDGKVIKGQFLYIGKNLDICLKSIENFKRIFPFEWNYEKG